MRTKTTTSRRAARGIALTYAALSLVVSQASFESVANAQPGAAPEPVIPPVVLTHVDAQYPPSALRDRKHADVTVAVTVDIDGHVSKVDVLESGGKDLDEAAVVAARQWTFTPALRGGKPVASRIRVPFHFAPPAPAPEVVPPPKTPEPQVAPHGAVPTTPAAPVDPNAAPAIPPAASPKPVPDDGEEVLIVGRAAPASRGASDFNFHFGELAKVPNKNASEMLRAAAPGLMLTNEGGEGHAEQVFLRGFDAREGQDLEFTVGGMPINESGNLHGNGYADTHFIIPELVESLRVIEGPFDPRQGNYAVAGSANYELGLAQRGLTAKYTAGSFGTQRMYLGWGPKNESRHTFGAAEIATTDGFGQNRSAQRASAMGQYEGRIGEKGSYRIMAQGYSTHFHTAGVIREDDYRAGRIGFYDSYDASQFARQQTSQGGDSSRYSVSADLETKSGDTTFTQQFFVSKRNMRLLEDFTGFLLDVQTPLQSVHAQRGDMLDLAVDETMVGAKGSARLSGNALGHKQELEFGYFARGDWTHGTQQRLEANTGVPYATDTDLTSTLGDIGLYADANLRALSWLNLRGGVRTDLFTFDVLDNCAVHDVSHPSKTNPETDQSCLTQQDFGRPREADTRSGTASVAVLPRGSVILGPFEHFSFNASYGQGVRSIDPSYITQDVKTPFASINAYEGGIVYATDIKDVTVVARSIFFETKVDKDLIFNESVGRNVLGSGTTRTGWVGALRLTGSFFDEAANLTFVRSEYDDTHLLVAYVPSAVFRSDTAIFSDLPISIDGKKFRGTLSGGITYVGPRALPFGQQSQDIFTVDASANVSWTRYEVGVMATNLFDTRYRLGEFNYASDFHSQPQPTLVPERHFTAGAPRGVFGTFAINFGGP
jgi:iron complex outermembrane receptor protein